MMFLILPAESVESDQGENKLILKIKNYFAPLFFLF